MRLQDLNDDIREALAERGHDDRAVGGMTPKEVFVEYCEWHGLVNWGGRLWSAVETCRKADGTDEPFSLKDNDYGQTFVEGPLGQPCEVTYEGDGGENLIDLLNEAYAAGRNS